MQSAYKNQTIVKFWFLILLMLCLLPILEVIFFHDSVNFRNWQYFYTALCLFLGIGIRKKISAIPAQFLMTVWVAFLILFLASILGKYLAVAINGIDFSIFDLMLYNSYHEKFMYSPIYNVNHMGIHPSWIMVLLIPFHQFFQSPMFLLLLGNFLLWMAAIPLWFLGKEYKLNDGEAALITLAYLTTPFVGTVLNNGFRIESWIPCLTFSFLLFWQKKIPLGWIIFGLLLLAVKEDVALYIVGFSLYFLIFSERRKASGLLCVLSMAVFVFNVKITQPYFLAGDSNKLLYLGFWKHFGQTKSEIVTNMFLSPGKVLQNIVTSGWWKLYLPLLFIPLFSLTTLFASLPGILILGTAASYPTMHQWSQYYPLVLFSFALFGMMDAKAKMIHSDRIWSIVLLIFPLFNAGWLTIKRPDYNTLNELAKVRVLFRANYSHRTLCTQAIAFPYLGYEFALQALDKQCVLDEEAYILILPAKDPYPYSKVFLDELILQAKNRQNIVYESENVVLMSASDLKELF